MCYEFTLYLGCGHDRSKHFFRPFPQTPHCLCSAFSRLPAVQGFCPDCERILKLSQGIQVEQDPLSAANRLKAKAWRERVESDIKERENNKKLGDPVEKNQVIKKGVSAAATFKGVSAPNSGNILPQTTLQYTTFNRKTAPKFTPKFPYVHPPGETFRQHIIAEVIDDAKSGGEMIRLLQAFAVGTQGYGWVGSTIEHNTSWLILSADVFKNNSAAFSTKATNVVNIEGKVIPKSATNEASFKNTATHTNSSLLVKSSSEVDDLSSTISKTPACHNLVGQLGGDFKLAGFSSMGIPSLMLPDIMTGISMPRALTPSTLLMTGAKHDIKGAQKPQTTESKALVLKQGAYPRTSKWSDFFKSVKATGFTMGPNDQAINVENSQANTHQKVVTEQTEDIATSAIKHKGNQGDKVSGANDTKISQLESESAGNIRVGN